MNEAIDLFADQNSLSVFTPMDNLFGSYQQARQAIEQIAEYVSENSGVMSYFFDGARVANKTGSYSVSTFFEKKHAIASLNAEYWSKVMNMTDVLDSMPAKMRSEWNNQIHEHQTPDFERETVLNTMNELLLNRAKFFSERVDGLFRSLSGEHVTNQPQGFGKRMIINRIRTYYDMVDHERAAYVHDLRVIIGKFMGREVPPSRATDYDISRLYDRGETGTWHSFDGGSWRLKLFKKGTAHMEIHPMMAYRLNQVLAQLYPMAIPAKHRQKPKQYKDHQIVTELIPFEVINELENFSRESESCLYFRGTLSDKAQEILTYIGGECFKGSWWQFDYPVLDVLYEIMRSGQLPEKKSHQFFQTPEWLAQHVVDLAGIEDYHEILEPSAGQGAIAEHLPRERTTCVEVSHIHCKILESKEFHVIHKDFLRWETNKRFYRIIMNPPFSDGRAMEHLIKAHSLLRDNGKLVAILPASMKGNTYFDGWNHTWSDVLSNEFKDSGTGVHVVILELTRD